MEIKMEDFTINNFSKTFIIAEISANHNGSLEIAKTKSSSENSFLPPTQS